MADNKKYGVNSATSLRRCYKLTWMRPTCSITMAFSKLSSSEGSPSPFQISCSLSVLRNRRKSKFLTPTWSNIFYKFWWHCFAIIHKWQYCCFVIAINQNKLHLQSRVMLRPKNSKNTPRYCIPNGHFYSFLYHHWHLFEKKD